jgi:phosphinothricin acetyltransferase
MPQNVADLLIRPAVPADLEAICGIYNQVIATSTTVYTEEASDVDERGRWMAARQAQGYPVLAAERDGAVIGFASFGDFRPWPGYRFTVEHSVHVAEWARGQGVGGPLVRALFPLAETLGKHVMVAGVDADNDGSIRFHERLGFERVAHFREVGFKFGRWLDLVFLQRRLGEGGVGADDELV